MTAKSVIQVFEIYKNARLQFAQSVADLACRPMFAEILVKNDALELLAPLLNDPVIKLQQCTCVALGRLVNTSQMAAEELVKLDILSMALKNLEKRSKLYRKSAMLLIRGLAKHTPELATVVVSENGLEGILACLEDFDPSVKEAAGWAIGYICKHNHVLAQACITAGAIPLLKMCLQEPEICLKQIAASALGDIAKHKPENAQAVVDTMAVPYLAKCLSIPDPRLKRQVLCCFANIARHSLDMAETIVEAEVFPELLLHLGHPDQFVARSSAILVKEIVKHHYQLAELVVNSGGLAPLIQLCQVTEGNDRLAPVMALGFIAAQSDQFSMAIINAEGVESLHKSLKTESLDHVKSTIVWTLGQIGKHGSEHSQALGASNVFTTVIQLYLSEDSSEDLKLKCRQTCKQSMTKCLQLQMLEPLLMIAPPEILKYILGQFSKQLPYDPAARRMFVTSGSLQRVQEIKTEPGSSLFEYINIINRCFPEEIVRYYSPGYSESILRQVDQYTPQIPPLFSVKETDDDIAELDLMSTLNDPPTAPSYDACNSTK